MKFIPYPLALGHFLLLVFTLMACQAQPVADQKSPNLTQNDTPSNIHDARITAYICDPTKVEIKGYWKAQNGNRYGNIGQLKQALETSGERLLFATNGGMFKDGPDPLGLYIEDGTQLEPMNTTEKAFGNFYLQPNGVFYVTEDHQAVVVSRYQFKDPGTIQFATQSGPMLLIDGEYHPILNPDSESLYIRNGVGILPDGKVLFALSTERLTFYEFATFFKEKGCQNALYLDGFVSKAYIPEKGLEQLNGQLGILIGVTVKD